MSNVIALLEKLACSPRGFEDPDCRGAVEVLEVAVRAAMTRGSSRELVAALGGREQMFCSIWSPDGDEQLPDEQPLAPEEEPEADEMRAA